MKKWFRVSASVVSAVVVSAGLGCNLCDRCSDCESVSGYDRPEIPAPMDEYPATFPTGTPVGVTGPADAR